MARKAFFAAFVIDEGVYTPEPGPVDNHFVAADLAQSSFGEQSGVSHIIVWNSADELLADHRSRGPITVHYLIEDDADRGSSLPNGPDACPSSHWNRGDDICADCGVDLNPSMRDTATPSRAPRPSFRDHLSPTMRDTLSFEYYEVRPCLERDHQVRSFRDEDVFQVEVARAQTDARAFRVFWSLYGVDRNTATAIGDVVSKDAAHEAMNAILAIPAAARNALQDQQSATDVKDEHLAQKARRGRLARRHDQPVLQSPADLMRSQRRRSRTTYRSPASRAFAFQGLRERPPTASKQEKFDDHA